MNGLPRVTEMMTERFHPKLWFVPKNLGVLRRFQHCTGHITTGSFVGRGNQYIPMVKVRADHR